MSNSPTPETNLRERKGVGGGLIQYYKLNFGGDQYLASYFAAT